MKRILIAACLAGLPVLARAQATPSTAAPVVGVKSDSAPQKPSGFLFRAGGFIVSGERNTSINNSLKTGTGSVKGLDVLLRGSGVGLSFRSLAGNFDSQPDLDVISADVNLLLGPPAFTVSVGASKRALSTPRATYVYTFGRAGVQTTFLVGGSGLSAQLGAWGYLPASTDQNRMKIGGEGEGSIIYTPAKVPIFFQLGYRAEVFTTKTTSTESPEEVRGLRLGAGLQLGGK